MNYVCEKDFIYGSMKLFGDFILFFLWFLDHCGEWSLSQMQQLGTTYLKTNRYTLKETNILLKFISYSFFNYF